jgi:hypothetical protein
LAKTGRAESWPVACSLSRPVASSPTFQPTAHSQHCRESLSHSVHVTLKTYCHNGSWSSITSFEPKAMPWKIKKLAQASTSIKAGCVAAHQSQLSKGQCLGGLIPTHGHTRSINQPSDTALNCTTGLQPCLAANGGLIPAHCYAMSIVQKHCTADQHKQAPASRVTSLHLEFSSLHCEHEMAVVPSMTHALSIAHRQPTQEGCKHALKPARVSFPFTATEPHPLSRSSLLTNTSMVQPCLVAIVACCRQAPLALHV